MRNRLRPRGATVVAIVAAYAVALQLLFTGMLATQMATAALASGNPFAICTSGSDDGAHKSGGAATHQQCMAACSFAAAVFVPPAPIAATVERCADAITFRPAAAPADDGRRIHSPRSSQGPPEVA